MAAAIEYLLEDVDDKTATVVESYVLSKNENAQYRLDNVTSEPSKQRQGAGGVQNYSLKLYTNYVKQYLSNLFLPIGYPHSVTSDYTPYQIYDSIQAFASSIAGLLSSRAVLQSLEVISSAATDNSDAIPAASTSAATAATLLSVLQTTLANVTSILFASHAAPRISSDVKYYRFLADVVNDAAFVLDLLAPAMASAPNLPAALSFLPLSPRAIVLCTSSMLRAVCGVAAGSSKAVLSNHFAHNNPESIGDLNAKDGSQETVIGLLGMWAGGVVVSRVESSTATWCWMIALLCLHLFANYQAVRSVRLRGLNRERASLVCCSLVSGKKTIRENEGTRIETVGSKESVLGTLSLCQSMLARASGADNSSVAWKGWRIGVSIQAFRGSLDLGDTNTSRDEYIGELLRIFEKEKYLLHWNDASSQALVVLKVDARPADQLKAWLHATYVHQRTDEGNRHSIAQEKNVHSSSILIGTLQQVEAHWETCQLHLEQQGWDLNSTNLKNGSSWRLKITSP